jgi:ACS family hexuronate transporter-like MFS transporter
LGNFRWGICGLLLFGTTKNYRDRNVLGVLNTTLQHDLGWTEIDYSNLVAFQAAYAVGMLVAGRFIDRVGTRHICAVPATAKAPLTASAAGTA